MTTTTTLNVLNNKEWRNEHELRHELTLSYLYLEEKHNHGTRPGMGRSDE